MGLVARAKSRRLTTATIDGVVSFVVVVVVVVAGGGRVVIFHIPKANTSRAEQSNQNQNQLLSLSRRDKIIVLGEDAAEGM
jgi:hypothetical protein